MIPRVVFRLLCVWACGLVIGGAAGVRPATAQNPAPPPADSLVDGPVRVDTTVIAAEPEPAGVERTHSPRGALVRGFIVPGWGQVYNRQFLKLPFVYGALGGMVALAVRNYRNHRNARRAFLYAAGLEDDPNPYADYAPYYLGTQFEGITADQLFAFKNSQLRNRDLAFVGVLVVHSLAVLDAYVAAHLYDFDVGEDLSIAPTAGRGGAGVTVRLRW